MILVLCLCVFMAAFPLMVMLSRIDDGCEAIARELKRMNDREEKK